MEELRFFSIDALPEISPPIRPVMRRYLETRGRNGQKIGG